MRILVTGGAGYVGSVSVEALVAGGHEVIVLDDLSTGHDWAFLAGARLVRGSYGDQPIVRRLLEVDRIEAVLHCGARSLVGESMADPALYYRNNVVGGIALLEAMREAGVRRLVISSTAAVYGEPETIPIPETASLRPINPYGETKRTLEAAAGWYGATYGLRSVFLRYFNVAGASTRNGEVHEPEAHLVPNILAAAAGGPPLVLNGDDYPTPDGMPIRDYLHVEDLADAHLAALDATAPSDPRTKTPLACNLGAGRGFSNREVLAAAERVVGRPIPHTVGPRRPGDPPVLVAAIDRAREVLGWEPRRSTLEAMIGSAWAWR
ncbi:MAG: UDP-glucose 4-epimerase GalE, partial [Chloroflexi bacterium]|nr:UDP-glucose 4-epimerase GalE [Chloroflexota bacterium]